MSLTKIFKHITPLGVVLLTDNEKLKVDQILADLIYSQSEKKESEAKMAIYDYGQDYTPYPVSLITKEAKKAQDQENITRSKLIDKLTKEKQTMDKMTDNSPSMTGRQAKNTAIDDSLSRLSLRVSVLEERLDNTINRYQGNPSPSDRPEVAKVSEKPLSRPMMHVVDELPGDLGRLTERISDAIERISMIDDMIL